MAHLSFIIPFAVAFVGLMTFTVLLVKLLGDAIFDAMAKKSGEKFGAKVKHEEDVVGTRTAGQVSKKARLELSAVEQKPLQCARELPQ